MKEASRCKKRYANTSRILCLCLVCFLLATNLGGCIQYKNLQLPQLQEFKRSVRKDYPFTGISCQYNYMAGVNITVKRSEFDEECVYTILGYLKPIVCDEQFIQDLFGVYEKESHNDPNWKNGWRPEIRLHLSVDGKDRYQFTARANKEGYNSGLSPDDYTWDGYTTWYGRTDSMAREITPEEIEKKVKQYSSN